MKRLLKKFLWPAVALAAGLVLARMTIFAPQDVRLVLPERRDLSFQVFGTGTVEAKIVVAISSKITGKIIELHADQGDRVRQGQLLAKLENDDLIEQARQAEAAVRKARANIAVEAATLQKAAATLELAEKNARRYVTLAGKGVVSAMEAEQFDIAHRVAVEESRRAKAALEAAGMEEAQALAAQRFSQAKLADATLFAPHDGLILSRDLERGAIVTPGQSIFAFTDPATVWVKSFVDEARMGSVRVGVKALISLRSAPGKQFPGQAVRIGRQSDRVTEEAEVDVAFDAPLEGFRLGEQAEVLILAEERKNALSLPSAAFVTRDKKVGVWMIESGRLRFKEAAKGIEDRRGFTEMRGGIEEHDRVVVALPQIMAAFTDGQRARVTP